MPFVKLDCGIIDSSLWLDRDVRSLFITALVMADPYELSRPAEALDLKTMEPTGFVVPPGNYGFVRASGGAIVRADGCSKEAGAAALKALSEPDLDSRSSDFEGRRMVRVDGGFIVLNYWRYRMKDHSAAERMRRMRERQRDTEDPALRVTPRNVTHSASASASSSGSSSSEELQNSEVKELRADLQLAVLHFVTEFDFNPYLADVTGLLRSTRNPLSVMGVLRRHLVGMDVPVRTPREVGLAVQEYNATGEEQFKPMLFAGFLRKAPEIEQRQRGNAARRREEQGIVEAGEYQRIAQREVEEAEIAVNAFAAAHPDRYAELRLEAERDVELPAGQFRDAVVFGKVINLVRRETHASTD